MPIPEELQDRLADIRTESADALEQFMHELAERLKVTTPLERLAMIAGWQREPLEDGTVPPYTRRFHDAKTDCLNDGRSWSDILVTCGEADTLNARRRARYKHQANSMGGE